MYLHRFIAISYALALCRDWRFHQPRFLSGKGFPLLPKRCGDNTSSGVKTETLPKNEGITQR